MNRSVVTKRIIQGVAVAFGLLGLIWVFLGLSFAVMGIVRPDYFTGLFMAPMLFALGALVVAIAWQSLRHFGPRSIRHIVALAVVVICGWLSPWWSQLMDWLEQAAGSHNPMINLLTMVVNLLPFVLMYWSYRALSHKLIQLAGVADSEQGDPTLLSNAASDASCEGE
jgi:phosphoglycerol transferase MdoB-like AlkP superfamily enzyme